MKTISNHHSCTDCAKLFLNTLELEILTIITISIIKYLSLKIYTTSEREILKTIIAYIHEIIIVYKFNNIFRFVCTQTKSADSVKPGPIHFLATFYFGWQEIGLAPMKPGSAKIGQGFHIFKMIN